jgi:hypothetical protein
MLDPDPYQMNTAPPLPGGQRAQVGDDIVDALLGQAEETEHRHHVALPLCEHLLEHALPQEAHRHSSVQHSK